MCTDPLLASEMLELLSFPCKGLALPSVTLLSPPNFTSPDFFFLRGNAEVGEGDLKSPEDFCFLRDEAGEDLPEDMSANHTGSRKAVSFRFLSESHTGSTKSMIEHK